MTIEQPSDRHAFWQDLLTRPDLPGATKFVGFKLVSLDTREGICHADFNLPPQAANPAGHSQGGFVSAMLDEVMSVAACLVQDGPAMAPTLQMTTSFLRPCPIGFPIHGEGAVVRRGRQAIFTEGWLRDGDGKLLAQATASCLPKAFEG